jgi:hypothetical protein
LFPYEQLHRRGHAHYHITQTVLGVAAYENKYISLTGFYLNNREEKAFEVCS